MGYSPRAGKPAGAVDDFVSVDPHFESASTAHFKSAWIRFGGNTVAALSNLILLPSLAPAGDGNWKHHELPNVCPRDLRQLSEGVRRTLRRLRRRPTLITAFWKQASLFEQLPYIMQDSVSRYSCSSLLSQLFAAALSSCACRSSMK